VIFCTLKNLDELKNRATFGRQPKLMSKRFFLLAFFTTATFFRGMAQASQGDDFMRSMGKMYVVVAAIAIVFLGIVAFLIYLDRKLTKLENQTKHND
jgi:CcmD family protein